MTKKILILVTAINFSLLGIPSFATDEPIPGEKCKIIGQYRYGTSAEGFGQEFRCKKQKKGGSIWSRGKNITSGMKCRDKFAASQQSVEGVVLNCSKVGKKYVWK